VSKSCDCNPWHLCDSEIELLRAAANTNDTSDAWLATITPYTKWSIRSYFGRIEWKMGVRPRGVAITEALRVGLIQLDPALFERYRNPDKGIEERETVSG
jgi:hypothetical protein